MVHDARAQRQMLVTIDTEIDRDADWRIADPVSFSSVMHGIADVLTPLFERYGVRPTYLLSAEVLEHDPAIRALLSIPHAELGAHLHAELIDPERLVPRERMAGTKRNTIQAQYEPEVERAKLRAITNLFHSQLGRRPTAFRAGRFGMSTRTLEFLAELDYRCDSSVTPGIRWDYSEGTVDYRNWGDQPRVVSTASGPIVELPITIHRSPVAYAASRLPIGSAVASRAARRVNPDRWLRPSRRSGRELIHLAGSRQRTVLVLMFHSVEIIPGRSPYSATPADVQRIVSAMQQLFAWWTGDGNVFSTMTEAAAMIRSTSQANAQGTKQ